MGGGLPCRSGAGGLARLVACRPCRRCTCRGSLLFLSPAYPAFSLLPCPLSPARARRALFPGGEGGDQGYFMQGAPPLASPAFNRLRHLQTFSNMNPAGDLPGWSPANLTAVVPGGGLNPSGTCSPCPGGEDHLKRRRRLRRIVPSPPVPPLLGCRHCPWKGGSFGFAPNRRLPCAGHPLGRFCKCRRRFNAGVPGASPPAK